MHLAADYRRTHVEIDTQECELPRDERTRIQEDLDLLAADLLDFPESQLFLKIVYHPRTERYHAQAKLKLPGKTIITGHYSPWLDDALKRCLAKARRRADHYKDNPDREAIDEAQQSVELTSAAEIAPPTEPAALHGRVAVATGDLGEAVERQDYRRFRLAMANHELLVRTLVRRWLLRYPQANALIGEELDTDDVAEEVFLMAFEQFGERPDEQSLADWLSELVDPAVRAVWADPLEREAASYARTFGSPGTRGG